MGEGNGVVERLERDNERLQSENDELRTTVESLSARVAELEKLLGRNSKNSSMPPSAEGFAKAPATPNRAARRRRPGKQTGDPGYRLEPVSHPDHVIVHTPDRCEVCARDLSRSEVLREETRQVFDLPEVRPVVTEHRAETRRCACGTVTTASFPPEAIGPTCYGPGVRALLTYLVVAQHLPTPSSRLVSPALCSHRPRVNRVPRWDSTVGRPLHRLSQEMP